MLSLAPKGEFSLVEQVHMYLTGFVIDPSSKYLVAVAGGVKVIESICGGAD